MGIEWRWLASFSASCLHAADAIARGRKLVEPRLADVLTPPALALREEIQNAGIPAARLWRNLLALGHHIENNRELALTASRKTVGGSAANETVASRIAGRIADLETAMRVVVPQLVDDLAMRARPLRELWDAYGPGLLKSIGQHTDDRLLIERAEIVLVHPICGGGGVAHLQNNSVHIEAVLTNNVPKLPEVIRLAWLIAQLNNDLPVFGENVHPDRLPYVAALAMLPGALQAAQDLEVGAYDPPIVELALSSWLDEPQPSGTSDILIAWWQTYEETRPPWETALRALDKMLVG